MRIAKCSGIYGILYNDKNSCHSQKAFKLTCAYHLLFTRDEINLNQLSYVMSAGFIWTRIEKSTFIYLNPVVKSMLKPNSFLIFDNDVSNYLLNYYTHATVQGAITNKSNTINVEGYHIWEIIYLALGTFLGLKTLFFGNPLYYINSFISLKRKF